MKIIEVEPILVSSKYGDGNVLGQPLGVKTLGFAKITTDSGLIGYGEAYCAIYVPELFSIIINELKSFLLDKDPTDPKGIYDSFHIPFVSRAGLYKSVYSAIDIALWDISSQYYNKSIANLINDGELKKQISVYASGGSAAFTPEQIQSDLDLIIKKGHTSYKMRVGFQTWEKDISRIETAKSMLPVNGNLMVDAIMGTIQPPWNLETAILRSKDLSRFSLAWLEEPLNPDNIEDYSKLNEISTVPIAAGEALTSKAEFVGYITKRCVSILQPDVTHCGGITPALEICKIAERFGIPVAMHVWGSPLAFRANAVIAQVFNHVQWLEIPTVQLDFSNSINGNTINVEEGNYHFPDRIGFEFAINKKQIESFPFVSGSGFKMPKVK